MHLTQLRAHTLELVFCVQLERHTGEMALYLIKQTRMQVNHSSWTLYLCCALVLSDIPKPIHIIIHQTER